VNGKFLIEPKDLVKQRLGRSPDYGDALFETFVLPDMPNETMSRIRGRNTTAHDGDPFETGRAESDGDPNQ
jgi:hypothetical protein